MHFDIFTVDMGTFGSVGAVNKEESFSHGLCGDQSQVHCLPCLQIPPVTAEHLGWVGQESQSQD